MFILLGNFIIFNKLIALLITRAQVIRTLCIECAGVCVCGCVCVLPAYRLWLESWCLAACRSWLLVQLETCWIPKSPVPEQSKCIFSHGPLFGSSLHSCFDYFSIAAKSSRSSSTATPRSPGCSLCTQVLSTTTRFCLDLTQAALVVL